MKNYSVQYSSAVVVIIMTLSRIFELDFDQGQVTEVVMALITLVAAVVAWQDRVRKGDITWWGRRK